jgi:F-type H+-transporting ATPase subunit gamma
MSTQLKEVRRRIGNTLQIRRVTGTLQRVAAARLPGDQEAIARSNQYTQRLRLLVRDLFAEAPGTDHPFLRGGPEGSALGVVVFGSERGLCGGFNYGLVGALEDFVADQAGRRVRLWTVGKIIGRRVGRLALDLDTALDQPLRNRRAETIDRVADALAEDFSAGKLGEVHVLYSRSLSPVRQEPVLEKVLPLERPETSGGQPTPRLFEPAPGQILQSLLPEYFRQVLDHAFLESLEAEDAARQSAMSRATDNAGRIAEDLRRQYSRLRQESITTEMIELAGGGMA